MKNGFNKVQKNIQEMRLPKLKFSQDNLENNFLNFLTSQKHFHKLIMFRGYLWNIFETEIRGIFLECSGNITLWLLEFAKRSTFVIVKSYILIQKQLFHWKLFKNSFPLKCSLDVPNIATLRELSANIPGILRAGWGGFLSRPLWLFHH